MMPMKPKICTPIQHPGSPSPTSNCNFGFTSWEEAVRQPTSKSSDHSLSCYILNVSSQSPRKTGENNTPQKMWLIDAKSGGKNRRDRVYLKIWRFLNLYSFETWKTSTCQNCIATKCTSNIATNPKIFRLKDILSIKSREWNVLHFEPSSISQRIELTVERNAQE